MDLMANDIGYAGGSITGLLTVITSPNPRLSYALSFASGSYTYSLNP